MQCVVCFGPESSVLDVSGVTDRAAFVADFVASKYLLDPADLWVTGDFPCFQVNLKLRGGKGGFGRAMKQEGERRSRRLPLHKDACRTVSGKRIGSLKAKRRVRELREKIRGLQEKRAEDKANRRQASLNKELEAIEQQQHEMTDSIRASVEQGLAYKPAERVANATTHDSDFDILYENV